MSDLHLEMKENLDYFKANGFEVTGDVLVLAGDTMYLRELSPRLMFWNWASKNYRQVLVIPGNHEYYGYSDVAERGDCWQLMFRKNIVMRGLNDFDRIVYNGHRFTPDDFNLEHQKCLHFLKQAVAESTARHIVVVTHHLPTLEVVSKQHRDSVLNGAFASELGYYIADSCIDAWIYGHSHTNICTQIGNTQIVCNQIGYVRQCEQLVNGFDPGRYLEL